MWKCRHCETLNEEERNSCVVCNEERATEPEDMMKEPEHTRSDSRQLTYICIAMAAIVAIVIILANFG